MAGHGIMLVDPVILAGWPVQPERSHSAGQRSARAAAAIATCSVGSFTAEPLERAAVVFLLEALPQGEDLTVAKPEWML
jgi:hypothetical protein